MTQAKAAELTGLSEMAIKFIATGRRENPEAETARKIANAFGATPWWVMTGEGDPPTSDAVRAAVARAREPAPVPHTASDFHPTTEG